MSGKAVSGSQGMAVLIAAPAASGKPAPLRTANAILPIDFGRQLLHLK